ncbi:ribosomal RNA small subunit methyltransferase A [Patescibacteria group bacterium]|nr:MAG: ribosomal RNA small subunit methyltransferase A [Patescibacteria group bacterium]
MTHIQPKKSLGQNFLIDHSVIDQIMAAAKLQSDDVVLEIGPGQGVLTEALSKKCSKVIAVEIDETLVTLLRNKFKGKKNIEIVTGDILKLNVEKIFTDYQLPITGYKVIANLPYYITSPIIRKFLESEVPPQEMILMVQKEVAERIVAKPGEMSILAVSVQYYARAEILFPVSKKAFSPVPEVESAVIRITHNAKRITSEEANKFFRIVRAGFCAKRKTLINNLANSFHIPRGEVEKKVRNAGLDSKVRAQELSVDDWQKLSALFQK